MRDSSGVEQAAHNHPATTSDERYRLACVALNAAAHARAVETGSHTRPRYSIADAVALAAERLP